MSASVSDDGAPAYGGPWWCPTCGRATTRSYRCSNYDCGADLAGVDLQPV